MVENSEFNENPASAYLKKRGNGSKIGMNSYTPQPCGVLALLWALKMLVGVVVWLIWNVLSDDFGWPRLGFFEFFGFVWVVSFFGGTFFRKSYFSKD